MILDLIIIGVAVLIPLAIMLWLLIDTFVVHKHVFILKRPTSTVPFVITTRARDYKDESGAPVWRLLRGKKIVPIPDEEAISITKKGKFYVEGWELEDGQIQYEKHPSPGAVDVASTNQRQMLGYQYARADRERRKSWKETILQIAVPLGFGLITMIIIIMGMVFWGDLAEPALQGKQLDLKIANALEGFGKSLERIENNVQILQAEVTDAVEGEVPN